MTSPNNPNKTPMCDDKINKKELYKIAIDTRNFEIGLFWQRSNYFLVLNTAIAVGFFSLDEFIYQLLLSIFGVLISILWFRVNLGSKYWQSRWENSAATLENELDDNINLFSASRNITDQEVKESLLNHNEENKLSCYDEWVLSKPSVSKSMSALSGLFILAWSLIAIILVYTCLIP